MADLGEPVRVIEVNPISDPVPSTPEPELVPDEQPVPDEIPAAV
jgi:hypothetical protein